MKRCPPLECIPTSLSAHLPRIDNIKAVIFDLYGTLFISGSGDIGVHASSQKEDVLRTILAQDYQLTLPPHLSLTTQLTSLIKHHHQQSIKAGIPFPEVEIRDLWRALLAPYASLPNEEIEQLAASYEATVNPVWPMPHLESTLSALQERKLLLGILSNAQFYTLHLFQAFLGKPLSHLPFSADHCLFSYQEKQAKPGAFLYKKLLNKLEIAGIPPESVLFVGNDMRNDIAPAHAVGFKTALFAGDQRSLRLREEEALPPPDCIITDLPQILEILESPLNDQKEL